MTSRCVGLVVSGEVVTVVDARIPDADDEPITIISDDTWKLQSGARPLAYDVLHQRCANYLREHHIDGVVIKGSARPNGPIKLAVLSSAEVRGVVTAAAASVCPVKVLPKALISRTYGDRNVDEYIEDDGFWSENTKGGKLRKSSREAAMLVIAARNT